MRKWRRHFILLASILTVAAILSAIFIYEQDQTVQARLSSGGFMPAWEIYSQGIPLSVGRSVDFSHLRQEFARNNWRERAVQQPLNGEDFKLLPGNDCARESGLSLKSETNQCLLLSDRTQTPMLIGFNAENTVSELWRGDPLTPTRSIGLLPKLVAQLTEGQPVLKKQTPLGKIPLACLQAVTAIEDAQFLDHSGVSITGILRAIYRNLRAGRWAEGGSTITQQLVKNYFLSSEKTMGRKFREQIIAVSLESRASKDFILEMYLNIIYMGQNGPYQVRGLGSAAEFYFDQDIAQLNLPQCALLAALLNSPGRYSPFEKPEAATARRHLVLQKMLNLNLISANEMATANQAPLPTRPSLERRETAPYYIASVVREFNKLALPTEGGLRIYTSLDPEYQSIASRTLAQQVPAIEARIKMPHTTPLQGALISVDLQTSQVLALVGGRDFRSTQFNRVLDAKRQIGSIVKPFVFWPAMKFKGPAEMLDDSPFEWNLNGQKWTPKNYDGRSHGAIPIFWALSQSLNMSTAKLGQEIGLGPIAHTLQQAGLDELPPELPSLTLGALELSPWQVAQIYSTLANFGAYSPLHTISRVEDSSGAVLYEYQATPEQRLDAPTAAVVVGMLKQTTKVGTARSLKGLTEFFPLAGKTGTTSDTKDAWFVGFTPRSLTVVWLGFDDNTAMGLTGASAALPVWNAYFQQTSEGIPRSDFTWPPQTVPRTYDTGELKAQFPVLRDMPNLPEKIELILKED